MATSMPELLKWPRFEQFVLRSGIISDASGVDSPKRSKTMGLGAGIEYVHHRTIGSHRGVRDQEPVTAPRNRLGAHDHGGLEPRECQKIFERLLELPRLHVVGVGPKAGVPPLSVVRIAPARAACRRATAGECTSSRHRPALSGSPVARSAGIAPMWGRREHRSDVSRLLLQAVRETVRAIGSSARS